MVAQVRFELTTPRSSGECSTPELPGHSGINIYAGKIYQKIIIIKDLIQKEEFIKLMQLIEKKGIIRAMKLTKIICTIGPATSSPELLSDLIDEGMDIARLNFSHGTHDDHKKMYETIRRVSCKKEANIAIMLDTKGAEIRTGDTQTPFQIKKGEEVIFSPCRVENEKRQVIHVNYDDFAVDVAETDRILIDSGEMSFSVLEIRDDGSVLAKSNDKGVIGSRRHINLPGADIDLPSVTAKDWEDISFGLDLGVDFLALSFVRTAKEIEEVRKFTAEKKSHAKIISKIETRVAVDNLVEIIAASDGVMVARGDLGADVPLEEVPAIQDDIVALCREYKKPVIVATNMLESMIVHPVPTRAELTDIAHAVTTKADATMLSGETANGAYPVKAVEMMRRVIAATENRNSGLEAYKIEDVENDDEALAQSAVKLCEQAQASCLVVSDDAGALIPLVSYYRPLVNIIACFKDNKTVLTSQNLFAVLPVMATIENREQCVEYLKNCPWQFESGDQAVFLCRRNQNTIDASLEIITLP